MIYPKFIKTTNTIGVTAPSDGTSNEFDLKKLKNSKRKLEDEGFKLRITDNCYTSSLGRSSSSVIRARELENLFLDNDVASIIAYSGGDFLMEMLSVLRYDIIWNNPKWIQGYSDITGLLFTITTNLGIATIYGNNFKAFSMQTWHESLVNNIEILKGNVIKQNSFDKYQKNRLDNDSGYEVYNLDGLVKWKSIDNNNCNFSGRLIGGCLDCILNIIGTKFDKTKNFLEKYRDDGFIWYFDIFDMSYEDITRAIWQLKEAGWFKYIKGVVFGRLTIDKSFYDISFNDVLKDAFEEFNVPILYDADLGHIPPRLTLINGALAQIDFFDNKASVKMILK